MSGYLSINASGLERIRKNDDIIKNYAITASSAIEEDLRNSIVFQGKHERYVFMNSNGFFEEGSNIGRDVYCILIIRPGCESAERVFPSPVLADSMPKEECAAFVQRIKVAVHKSIARKLGLLTA